MIRVGKSPSQNRVKDVSLVGMITKMFVMDTKSRERIYHFSFSSYLDVSLDVK